MTKNAENLRIMVFQVFSLSKTAPQLSSFCCSPKWKLLFLLSLGFHALAGQDCIFSLQRKGIFTAASRLGLLLSSFDLEVLHCSELSLTAAKVVFTVVRLAFTAVSTPCLDSSICIYFRAFQLFLCIFIAFVT